MKRIVMSMIAFAALSVLPSIAEAECTLSGAQVERVSVSGGDTASFLHLRVNALDAFTYYCWTTDPKVTNAALVALTGKIAVRLNAAEASSCPANGSSRFIATCSSLQVNP